MKYKEIKGDLIKLAQQGEFDVITHGCNCFCTMGAGIAPKMAKAFNVDKLLWEHKSTSGKIQKLGGIDYATVTRDSGQILTNKETRIYHPKKLITVVNSYTQYGFGKNHKGGLAVPLDYEALALCLRKINHIFKGQHIGLPQIGCGLAGGDWDKVKAIISSELRDCNVTVVIYENTK